jgi:hypothetical protein
MIGPKDRWEVELEKVSRSGLVALAKVLLLSRSAGRKESLEWALWSRKIGRQADLATRIERFLDDPRADTQRSMRRSTAAKKAARRRKKERKAA